MWIAGHIASGYLFGQALKRIEPAWTSWHMLGCLIGSLAPDLIDKPLMLVGWTPYGRSVGHGLLIALWVCLVVAWLVRRTRQGYAGFLQCLATGWLAHLLCDFLDDSMEGVLFSGQWFTGWAGWPYTTPDDCDVKGFELFDVPCHGCLTPLEWGVVAVALCVLCCGVWRQRERGGSE